MEIRVALLAEGVDRNLYALFMMPTGFVALLAEGVDRNIAGVGAQHGKSKSPSSQRAWIEIASRPAAMSRMAWSPSSQRAWIEIISQGCAEPLIEVALLAEGVDRNFLLWT